MTVSYFADRPEIVKIFNDLESYKDWCVNSWVHGDSKSYVFDEKDLYNNASYPWQMYNRHKNRLKKKLARKRNRQRN